MRVNFLKFSQCVLGLSAFGRLYVLISKMDSFIIVKSHKRYNVSHEGMLTALDPCESPASMHLAIRELECECKFLYNFNCRPDCPNRTPTNAPGKKKSKKEKEAYDKARNEFRNDAEKKLGLRIGMLYTVHTMLQKLSKCEV